MSDAELRMLRIAVAVGTLGPMVAAVILKMIL